MGSASTGDPGRSPSPSTRAVTTPIQTLNDVAPRLSPAALERVLSEADKLDRIDWSELECVVASSSVPGAARLRRLISSPTFVLTDSELERLFSPIAKRAGLPKPLSRHPLDDYLVDFFWPDLGLVVEVDGLRYHRTPLTQARDTRRDQVHVAAGRTPVRFTYAQVAYRPHEVERTLQDVARRLRRHRAA
jgi:very-short-patch-repair endonuclease